MCPVTGDNVATDELLGATIAGRYRIISRLGAGGMGVAYRAWDEQGGLPVVIKIPKKSFLEDPKFAERFYREIRLLQGLKHPHIVPIVDVGEHEGLPFVVMRFLPGGSLSNRRLRDEKGKPRQNFPETLHLWLLAIADALDYVHSQGVVHRDVKPGNIFFDAFWGAYLGDFGIAKIVEESDAFDKEHTLTATHMGIGTPDYMAPEQFTPKAVIDGRADQYALGVIVYEMLAGKRPFVGDTAHIVVEVTTRPVPALPVPRGQVPPLLAESVYRALAKHPSQRFATCRDFAAAALRDVQPMTDEPGVARLLCPQCSNILKLPTAAAGQKGKCPKCQTQMKVADDLGALWLLDEARKQQKAAEIGSDESPRTPSGGVDEKALKTFEPVSSQTPQPGRTTRLPQVPSVLAFSVALAAIALSVLAVGMSSGEQKKKRLSPSPPPYDVRLAEALQTVERDSLDQDANDFVARHYCFKRRDWKRGLRYLEKSPIPDAAALAKEEIAANAANPAVPGTLVRLARGWWDYGGRTDLNTPESAAATRLHAADIYSEYVHKITDQSDADWVNQWLDSDKDFAQLVNNLRPTARISERVLYLSEMPEIEARVAHKGFGKGTIDGPQNAIRSIVDGHPSPHGLSMHPGDGPDGQCFVRYRLPEGCARMKSIVTLDQSGSFEHCGIGFEVVADGQSVWKSKAIDKSHQSEQCDVAITGCRNIELRTFTVTAAFGGHAVWIEPRIVFEPGSLRTNQTTASSNDKAAVEWVLQRGGTVEIETADKSRKRLATIDELNRLPGDHGGVVVKAEERLRWQNEKNIDSRLVYHASKNVWREENLKGEYVFSFAERSRNPDFVELFDGSRKVVLRAYPDRVMYSDASGNAFELWRGAWVDGPDKADEFWVVGIELTAKPNVTDQGLACVAALSRLEWLGVGGTAVTDALFDHLRTLPNLRGIGVNWTGVSGHGLASLADSQLRHLEISGMKDPEVAVAYLHKKGVAEWINFDGVKMTPECVRLLGEIKTLKTLHFRNGLITDEQLETLKKQLPACHFHIWK
jgi:serine/threonine protein kinase